MRVDRRLFRPMSHAQCVELLDECLAVCADEAPDRGPLAELSERLGVTTRSLQLIRAGRLIEYRQFVCMKKIVKDHKR